MALKIVPGLIRDVLANIFKKPATIGYPAVKTKVPPDFRGKIWVNENCISCGACVRACPAKCIKLEKDKITVWTMRCINCTRCVEVCPVKAILASDEYEIVSPHREESYVRKYEMAKCKECGEEFDNLAKIKYMAEKTKQPVENFMICIPCKQKKAAAAPKPGPVAGKHVPEAKPDA